MNRKIYNEYVTIFGKRTCSGAWMHRTDRACLCCGKKQKKVLGKMPDHITMRCSGNNYQKCKRSKSTEFRRNERRRSSGGTRNYRRRSSQALEVLEHVTDRESTRRRKLLKAGFCDCVFKRRCS